MNSIDDVAFPSALEERKSKLQVWYKKVSDFLLQRRRAYELVFDKNNQFTDVVLADLAKFCRANSTTFHPDPRVHAALEGRREVWLRISNHLNLSTDELIKIYARRGTE